VATDNLTLLDPSRRAGISLKSIGSITICGVGYIEIILQIRQSGGCPANADSLPTGLVRDEHDIVIGNAVTVVRSDGGSYRARVAPDGFTPGRYYFATITAMIESEVFKHIARISLP
jgi:hypothetical protein